MRGRLPLALLSSADLQVVAFVAYSRAIYAVTELVGNADTTGERKVNDGRRYRRPDRLGL